MLTYWRRADIVNVIKGEEKEEGEREKKPVKKPPEHRDHLPEKISITIIAIFRKD
jgi:hypothetical protein